MKELDKKIIAMINQLDVIQNELSAHLLKDTLNGFELSHLLNNLEQLHNIAKTVESPDKYGIHLNISTKFYDIEEGLPFYD